MESPNRVSSHSASQRLFSRRTQSEYRYRQYFLPVPSSNNTKRNWHHHSKIALLFPDKTPSFSSSDKKVALRTAPISNPYVIGGAYGKSYTPKQRSARVRTPPPQSSQAAKAFHVPSRKPTAAPAHHTPTTPSPALGTPAQQRPRTTSWRTPLGFSLGLLRATK